MNDDDHTYRPWYSAAVEVLVAVVAVVACGLVVIWGMK